MSMIFGGVSACDPAKERQSCDERGIPTDHWWGKANYFELPLGREPGRGHILLRKSDLDALDRTGDHNLRVIGETTRSVLTLTRITLLHAECITPGSSADDNAVFLCEIADRRHFLAKVPLDAAYNVRDPDGGAYLTPTLNTGVAWTWQEIVQDLANTLGIGTLTLPFTPDATPHNLSYFAGSAWDALCDVLNRLACAVKYDPTDDTFSVVRLGDVDIAASVAVENLDRRRTWDTYDEEPLRAWRPEFVRVYFLRRPQPTGGTSPYYSVDVTLDPEDGVEPETYVTLYDDLTAEGDTGSPSNAAALSTRAAERAADWLRKEEGYVRRLIRVYRDFRPQMVSSVLGSTAGAVALDDRGGLMGTVMRCRPDERLEAWRPLEQKVYWPMVAGSSPPAAAGAFVRGPAHSRNNTLVLWNGSTGSWVKQSPILFTAVSLLSDTAALLQVYPDSTHASNDPLASLFVSRKNSITTGASSNLGLTTDAGAAEGMGLQAYGDTAGLCSHIRHRYQMNGAQINILINESGGNIIMTVPSTFHVHEIHYSSDGTVGLAATTRTVKDGAGANKIVTIKDGIITDWEI